MSELYIDGVSFSLFIESIKQGSSMQQLQDEFYGSEPSGSSSFPNFRRVVITFVIYDPDAEDIARDLEALFRSRKQFCLWMGGYNIIHGHKYILAKPDDISIPRDSDSPNHLKGTLTIDVLGLGGDYGYLENNYVRIKYKPNDWNLEG